MNLSNKLTIFRLLCVPVVLTFLFIHDHLPENFRGLRLTTSFLADMIFIAAAISDYWDGKLARIHGWVTNFGRLMDPVADKVLVIALFIALVEQQIFAAWMVAAIVLREFVVTGIRLLALQQNVLLSAEKAGKIKAGWQLATIITVLTFFWFHDAALLTNQIWLHRILNPFYPSPLWWVAQGAMAVALYYTLRSGWNYVRDNWNLITAGEI